MPESVIVRYAGADGVVYRTRKHVSENGFIWYEPVDAFGYRIWHSGGRVSPWRWARVIGDDLPRVFSHGGCLDYGSAHRECVLHSKGG